MEVPFFDMRAELADSRALVEAAILRVVESGQFVGGPEVAAFEAELAAATGSAHAIGTSSGTDALLAILMAMRIGPGDEVVTTPFTFFATAGAIARLGARIVFADIDPVTLNLDPRAALAACTPRTRAILVVNLFGLPAVLPMGTPCPIVEDAAQSIGAAPVRGIAAALSCFPTKNLGALGDAGAVLTNDPELADRVSLLRNHGARPKYHHVELGGNFRLDAIQAAVLRAKLPALAARTAARRALAARYRDGLAGVRDLVLPPSDAAHVYHQFVVRVPDRDRVRARLAAAGIGTEVYYPEPLHLAPCFSALAYRAGSFPEAERAAATCLALPIYSALGEASQMRVIAALRQ